MDVRACINIISNALRPINSRIIGLRSYNIGMFPDLLVMSPNSIVAGGCDRGGRETFDIRLQLLELLLMR
jgi:hypothetical protein